jgi:serine/threonine-protein kinase
MAEVYLAMDNATELPVVIKRVTREFRENPEFSQMFFDEARIVATLDHPHIVKIHDLGFQDDGRFYMVLEWLEGWDLQQIMHTLRGRPVPVPIALRLAADACRGLHAAHTARSSDGSPLNVIHRDISPHNLFVTKAGVLKLLDFGVAKSNLQESRTEVGQIKGKLAYMSPEQLGDEKLDFRSDLFSLGIVLHEMLTGDPLFSHLSIGVLPDAILHDPIPPPVGSIPETVAAITMKALQRAPDLRFATAADMGIALETELKRLRPDLTRDEVSDFVQDSLWSDTAVHGPAATVAIGRLGDRRGRTLPYLDEEHLDQVHAAMARFSRVNLTASRRGFTGFFDRFRTAVFTRVEHFFETPRQHIVANLRTWSIAGGVTVALLVALIVAISSSSGTDPPNVDRTAAVIATDAPRDGVDDAARESPASDDRASPGGSTALVAEDVESRVSVASQDGHADVTSGADSDAAASAPKPVVAADATVDKPRRKRRATVPGNGTLTVESIPWAQVYLGDELIGPTPIVKQTVPAGVVRIRLVNEQYGVDWVQVIRVRAGQLVKKRFDFRKPSPAK